jgi:hypothetical protein
MISSSLEILISLVNWRRKLKELKLPRYISFLKELYKIYFPIFSCHRKLSWYKVPNVTETTQKYFIFKITMSDMSSVFCCLRRFKLSWFKVLKVKLPRRIYFLFKASGQVMSSIFYCRPRFKLRWFKVLKVKLPRRIYILFVASVPSIVRNILLSSQVDAELIQFVSGLSAGQCPHEASSSRHLTGWDQSMQPGRQGRICSEGYINISALILHCFVPSASFAAHNLIVTHNPSYCRLHSQLLAISWY